MQWSGYIFIEKNSVIKMISKLPISVSFLEPATTTMLNYNLPNFQPYTHTHVYICIFIYLSKVAYVLALNVNDIVLFLAFCNLTNNILKISFLFLSVESHLLCIYLIPGKQLRNSLSFRFKKSCNAHQRHYKNLLYLCTFIPDKCRFAIFGSVGDV